MVDEYSHPGVRREKVGTGHIKNMREQREGNDRNQRMKYGSERID
jgi:hypothetical protein